MIAVIEDKVYMCVRIVYHERVGRSHVNMAQDAVELHYVVMCYDVAIEEFSAVS
jgi:hypothetical protein